MINEELLYNTVFELYLERGVRFTMDDLSVAMGISKRTLYETVSSKEQLAFMMVEKYFDQVYERQSQIFSDDSLNTVDKIKRLLTAMPITILDKRRLDEIKREYPNVFSEINLKLSAGWEMPAKLFAEAEKLGLTREFDINLFRLIYVSSLEAMLFGFNLRQETSFSQMQDNMVDILLNGVLIK